MAVTAEPSGPAQRVRSVDVPRLSRRVSLWGPALAIGVAGYLNRWNAEDSFINFRVVDQILAGNGPVFNAGERVEAATSTLWLWLLTLGTLLTGSVEWFAVLAGLAGTVAGVALAGSACVRLAESRDETAPVRAWLPFGTLVFLALPPAWHFATSGLETGLSFAWIGASYAALVNATVGQAPRGLRRLGTAVLLGLGPLVRPDLAVFTVAYLAALALAHRGLGHRWLLRTTAMALALPTAYQVFRMGYYGALVPAPAIAKEASSSRLDQGLTYLGDFVAPYVLWLPLTVLALVLVGTVRRSGLRSPVALAMLAPVVAGLMHAVFVTRVGGDFMHGRLLLPGLFGIVAPLGVVALRRGRESLTAVPVAVVATWSLVAAVGLSTDYHGTAVFQLDKGGIVDEHAFYVAMSGKEHPVTLEDYRESPPYLLGSLVRGDNELGMSYVSTNLFDPDRSVEPREALDQDIVVLAGNIGIFGYRAGTDVWVVDALGLADPFAARTELEPDRPGRIGHEKSLHPAWVLARLSAEPPPGRREVAAAARALDCGEVARLEKAVRDPLTVGRFAVNFFDSPRLTLLRLDFLPTRVVEDEC